MHINAWTTPIWIAARCHVVHWIWLGCECEWHLSNRCILDVTHMSNQSLSCSSMNLIVIGMWIMFIEEMHFGWHPYVIESDCDRNVNTVHRRDAFCFSALHWCTYISVSRLLGDWIYHTVIEIMYWHTFIKKLHRQIVMKVPKRFCSMVPYYDICIVFWIDSSVSYSRGEGEISPLS